MLVPRVVENTNWLPAFSPFSTMFLKRLLYMVVKKSGLCGKGLNTIKNVTINEFVNAMDCIMQRISLLMDLPITIQSRGFT